MVAGHSQCVITTAGIAMVLHFVNYCSKFSHELFCPAALMHVNRKKLKGVYLLDSFKYIDVNFK